MIDIDKAISTAVRTGKVTFGANIAVKNAKAGKAKMIIVAANCPKDIKEEIEYYGKLSKVPVMTYKGSSIDLATTCNKLFVISALSIKEPGDSEILNALEESDIEETAGGS